MGSRVYVTRSIGTNGEASYNCTVLDHDTFSYHSRCECKQAHGSRNMTREAGVDRAQAQSTHPGVNRERTMQEELNPSMH